MNRSKTEMSASGPGRLREGTLGAHLLELAQDPDWTRPRPALVVQGGGMRGIYSLSALAVLEELGLRDAFSRVLGSSAGAINAAYFLAGQARESRSIYYEDLSGNRFINRWRLRKWVDIDYMIEMLKRKHELEVNAMDTARPTLYTILTDAKTGEAKTISSRSPGFDTHVYEIFRATAALPWLYGKRVAVGDRDYVDGGLAGLVPLDEAQAARAPAPHPGPDTVPPEGAVVLLTRTAGHRKDPCHPALRACASIAVFSSQSRAVRTKVSAGDKTYNDVMERLENEGQEIPRKTWTVRPSSATRLVGRTTTDPGLLCDCAELARADTLDLLAQSYAADPARPASPESQPIPVSALS